MGHEHTGTDDNSGFGTALSTIAPGRQQALLARLFGLLAAGERLAQHLARLQMRLAPTRREARFLRAQVRQEQLHAGVFELAQRRLTDEPEPLDVLYEPFRQQVQRAAAVGDYYECIVATQVVLEHVGESLLRRLDVGMERRGAGLRRLRRLFLAQESAHHAFGQRVLREALADGRCDPLWLARCAESYLSHVPQWFASEHALSEAYDFDADTLVDSIRNELVLLQDLHQP